MYTFAVLLIAATIFALPFYALIIFGTARRTNARFDVERELRSSRRLMGTRASHMGSH